MAFENDNAEIGFDDIKNFLLNVIDNDEFFVMSQLLSSSYDIGRDEVETENAKLLKSVKKAAGIITDMCDECPVSRYEWLPFDKKCEGECTDDMAQCWAEYLTGARWGETGNEVNE